MNCEKKTRAQQCQVVDVEVAAVTLRSGKDGTEESETNVNCTVSEYL